MRKIERFISINHWRSRVQGSTIVISGLPVASPIDLPRAPWESRAAVPLQWTDVNDKWKLSRVTEVFISSSQTYSGKVGAEVIYSTQTLFWESGCWGHSFYAALFWGSQLVVRSFALYSLILGKSVVRNWNLSLLTFYNLFEGFYLSGNHSASLLFFQTWKVRV